VVRRRGNPFANAQKRLPYRAYIGRQGPWRRVDREEIDATAARIAGEAEYTSWAGGRGAEMGRTMFGFDTPEKAQAMQAWVDEALELQKPAPPGGAEAGACHGLPGQRPPADRRACVGHHTNIWRH